MSGSFYSEEQPAWSPPTRGQSHPLHGDKSISGHCPLSHRGPQPAPGGEALGQSERVTRGKPSRTLQLAAMLAVCFLVSVSRTVTVPAGSPPYEQCLPRVPQLVCGWRPNAIGSRRSCQIPRAGRTWGRPGEARLGIRSPPWWPQSRGRGWVEVMENPIIHMETRVGHRGRWLGGKGRREPKETK